MESLPALDLQRSFFDPLSRLDFDQAMALFDESATFRFPGAPLREGRAAVGKLLRAIRGRFGSLEWKAEPAMQGPSGYLFARWTVEGVFKTGKPYQNSGVSILRLNEAGRVVLFEDYFSSTDFSDS